MNLENHRPSYGTLQLSATTVRQLQQEWQFVESPAPRARFLDFPFAPEAATSPSAGNQRTEKRPLAA